MAPTSGKMRANSTVDVPHRGCYNPPVAACGAVAQLGEHYAGSVRVRGSNPLCSIFIIPRVVYRLPSPEVSPLFSRSPRTGSSNSVSSRGPACSRRVLLLVCLLASLALGAVHPVKAQGTSPSNIDLQLIVISSGSQPDQLAVAYATEETDEQIKQDFAEIAQQLGTGPPKVKVTRRDVGGKPIPAADAELPGLTDWRTGAINLDPLIRVYRRYGHFKVNFLFFGNYPIRPLGDVSRPPVRVAERIEGNSVSYEIWVDQSRGVPETVPTVSAQTNSRNLIVGVTALLLVLLGSAFLILQVLKKQRRATEAGEGMS